MFYIEIYRNEVWLAKIDDLYEIKKGIINKVCWQVWITI